MAKISRENQLPCVDCGARDHSARHHPKTKRASGRSLTADERRANGLALLQGLWLPAELLARVDRECERRGLRRTALVRTALEEWLRDAR